MKILITESKIEKLKGLIKSNGVESTVSMMGGFDTFCKVMNIESPMDFLHLFDDLEQVQSKEDENLTLFRYKKRNNFMLYDRDNGDVYINYDEIWSFLRNQFGLKNSEIEKLIEKWLDEVFNLRGVTTRHLFGLNCERLDEVYNLRGVTTKYSSVKVLSRWMRSTI